MSGEVRFGSVADMVSAERACVWTLGGLLDDAQFARLLAAAEADLSRFADADGMRFEMPVLTITARKPG